RKKKVSTVLVSILAVAPNIEGAIDVILPMILLTCSVFRLMGIPASRRPADSSARVFCRLFVSPSIVLSVGPIAWKRKNRGITITTTDARMKKVAATHFFHLRFVTSTIYQCRNSIYKVAAASTLGINTEKRLSIL